MEKVIIGEATADQIKIWRAKHRKVTEVTIVDGEETFKCYFKRPDMNTTSAVNRIGKTDEVKASEVLFNNCWLGGAEEIKEDAYLKMQAIKQLGVLAQSVSSSVKNL